LADQLDFCWLQIYLWPFKHSSMMFLLLEILRYSDCGW
jgi:hypothetical protein